MVDNDTQVGSEELGDVGEEVAEPDFDNLTGIVVDGLIGAVGGLVGTASMTVGLFIAQSLNAFDMQSFASLAELTGLGVIVPIDPLALGYLLFLAGGMITWPLLFASIGSYLPGRTFALKGLPFGFVLWTGFVLAFVDGVGSGTLTLALYAILTLIAHFAYGFTLGSVFDYFSDRPETIV
jgi:hypothetical protein